MSVQVCPECDIADCRHIRARRAVEANAQAAPAQIRDQALEDAAKECEKLRDDAKEQKALSTFNVAMEDGIEKTAVSRGEFWLTVSTFNAGLKRAAAVIRAMKGTT